MSAFQVVVPWRPGENELRTDAFVRVVRHLRPWTILTSDSEGETFAPGRARNLGVDRVTTPVVVFNDADTLVPRAQIWEAARLAGETPGLVYAYDLYYRLAENARIDLEQGWRETAPAIEREFVAPPSAGCIAISGACFRETGGFPEWEGWCWEDVAFAERCLRRWPVRRVLGPAFHLWHGGRRDDDSPEDRTVSLTGYAAEKAMHDR